MSQTFFVPVRQIDPQRVQQRPARLRRNRIVRVIDAERNHCSRFQHWYGYPRHDVREHSDPDEEVWAQQPCQRMMRAATRMNA